VSGPARFEQGAIRIENEREFSDLKAAIEKAFTAECVTAFLKLLASRGIGARDLDAVLAADAIDRAIGGQSGKARTWYSLLPVSDRSQVRELYLSKVEDVDPALRARFHRLYEYY
jgi:hypothetical protein